MAILTKPGSFTKGTPAALSISKSELAALGIVSGDPYFSDTANWSYVRLIYKSSVGNQRHSAKFDCAESTPASTFITSVKARDVFDIESISIVDFDGGFLSIPASALNAAEFQLDYTEVVPGAYITWSNLFNSGNLTVLANGGLTPSAGASPWSTGAYSSAFIASNTDFTLTYNINATNAAIEAMFGFHRTAPSQGNLVNDAMYIRSTTAVNARDGGNNTAYTGLATISLGTSHDLVIQRVGSTVTFKRNGVDLHSYTYTGAVYPYVLLGEQYTLLNTAHLL